VGQLRVILRGETEVVEEEEEGEAGVLREGMVMA
jgi:hypothetical protein